MLRKRRAHRFRHVEHRVKILRPTMIDPVPELAGPHADLTLGDTDFLELFGQQGTCQTHKRRTFPAKMLVLYGNFGRFFNPVESTGNRRT